MKGVYPLFFYLPYCRWKFRKTIGPKTPSTTEASENRFTRPGFSCKLINPIRVMGITIHCQSSGKLVLYGTMSDIQFATVIDF